MDYRDCKMMGEITIPKLTYLADTKLTKVEELVIPKRIRIQCKDTSYFFDSKGVQMLDSSNILLELVESTTTLECDTEFMSCQKNQFTSKLHFISAPLGIVLKATVSMLTNAKSGRRSIQKPIMHLQNICDAELESGEEVTALSKYQIRLLAYKHASPTTSEYWRAPSGGVLKARSNVLIRNDQI